MSVEPEQGLFGNVGRPRQHGYGLALNDRLFRLALGPERALRITTAPLEAPRVNTTSSAEEVRDEFGLSFARTSFIGGEGQREAHVEGAPANRFWASRNVDIRSPRPGEVEEHGLCWSVAEPIGNSSVDPLRFTYDSVNDVIYVTWGGYLWRHENPGKAGLLDTADAEFFWTYPHGTSQTTDYTDLAAIGGDVYVTNPGLGISKQPNGGAWAHWNDLLATRIWGIKGRIVAADGANLYEVDGSSTVAPTPLLTLAGGHEFTDACDAGTHVLVAATDGNIYAFATDTGSLVLEAQTLFEEEQVTTIAQTQGVVMVGTRQEYTGRWYACRLLESGTVQIDQMVREWRPTSNVNFDTEMHPQCSYATRDEVYTVTRDEQTNNLFAVWRYDVITGGVTENQRISGLSPSRSLGVIHIHDRLYISISADGFHQTSPDQRMSEGRLIGSFGDFYSASEKTWVRATLSVGELNAGPVELWYTTDPDELDDSALFSETGWTYAGTISGSSGSETVDFPINAVGRGIAGKVVLKRGYTFEDTPYVRSFSFHAYPASADEEVIVEVPINVSDRIERRGRRRMRARGRAEAEFAALKSYEGAKVLAQFFEPNLAVDGIVEQVSSPVLTQDTRGGSTMVAVATIRGKQVHTGSRGYELLVIMAGDDGSGSHVDNIEYHDPVVNRWHTFDDFTLSTPPQSPGVVVLPSSQQPVVLIGGWDSSNTELDSVRSYYLRDGFSVSEPGLPNVVATGHVGRAAMAVGVDPDEGVNGTIYIAGGWAGATNTDELLKFDPQAGTYTALAALPTPRHYMAGVFIDGMFHVFGGVNDPYDEIDEHLAYDPLTDTWTVLAPVPLANAPFHQGNAPIHNGEEVVLMPAFESTIYRYFPATDTYRSHTWGFSGQRHRHLYAVVNGRFHKLGGRLSTSDGVLSSHVAWEPPPGFGQVEELVDHNSPATPREYAAAVTITIPYD